MYPEQGQYINIHAHRGAVTGEEWVLQNISAIAYSQGDTDPGDGNQRAACSVGLHPWDLEEADVDRLLQKIEQATRNSRVLAIGETGMDGMIDMPMDYQEEIFRKQVAIAEKAGLPVIIHAVKTYQELIGYVKEHQPTVPLIIHGFRGGAQLAGDLLKFGFMLSFGEPLLQSEKVAAAFREVPAGKFFLETDESEVDIANLYERAAQFRSVSLQALLAEQHQLFRKIFHR